MGAGRRSGHCIPGLGNPGDGVGLGVRPGYTVIGREINLVILLNCGHVGAVRRDCDSRPFGAETSLIHPASAYSVIIRGVDIAIAGRRNEVLSLAEEATEYQDP